MITVEEAKSRIFENSSITLKKVELKVEKALNYTLAETIFSPLSLPSFDQSNVDGYAICGIENKKWRVIGEIKAGDDSTIQLKDGECLRIFTGAFVPDDVDAIIMQEFVQKELGLITIDSEITIKNGQQIRKKGSQIEKGELAISENKILGPASLSFLHMLGFKKINVYQKPKIALLITGNELVKQGKKLANGKVFEANSIAISSILKQHHFENVKTYFLKDNEIEIKKRVQKCLKKFDLLIFSGGISVGDYDFVEKVNQDLETVKIVYKIAQKPGKPLYFGKNDKVLIFGLPGNPASALTCMYEYVLPCLQKVQKNLGDFPVRKIVYIDRDFTKTGNLAMFLKGKYEKNGNSEQVTILEGQDSFVMHSFSEANCLIYLPKEKTQIIKDELVEIHLI